MKTLAAAAVALLVLAPGISIAAPSAPTAGRYDIDMAHASLNFRIRHMGLSNYTARFLKMTVALNFDPAHPQAQSVEAVIDANSLQTNFPFPEKLNFDAQIERDFLETAKYPQITFRSTHVEPTSATTAKVTGDLTLHGVTRPVILDATYAGGLGAGFVPGMGDRVGFSAHGRFKRSEFGMTGGLPAPPLNLGVGDEIEVIIEAEFAKPPPATAK